MQVESLLAAHTELGVVVPESEALAEKHELAVGWADYADAMLALQCDRHRREEALHSALDQVCSSSVAGLHAAGAVKCDAAIA